MSKPATKPAAKPTNSSPRQSEVGRYLKVFGTEDEHWAWIAQAAKERLGVNDWARQVLNAKSKGMG